MTKSKSSTKVKKDVPYLVGIDIGFGEIKRVSSAFPTPVTIPSAVASGARPSSSKLFDHSTIKDSSLVVTTEDGTFFVGEHAMKVPGTGSKRTQVRDRASDPISRVLFHTAIGLSVPHESGEYDVYLVTGLPNDDYDLSIKKRLEEFLNRTFEVDFHLSEEDTITKTINVIGSDIQRQPMGSVTYNQFQFDANGYMNLISMAPTARDYIGVIDLGHFTSDFGLFQNGKFVTEETKYGSTLGVTELYTKLKRKLLVKFDEMGYGYEATDEDLDKAVRTGVVYYMSKEFDVTSEIRQVAKEVASTIAKAVLDSWGNEVNRLQQIIVSGGGSHIFAEFLNEEFTARKKQGFEILDTPQFSNVLGFYMTACMNQAPAISSEVIFSEYVIPVFSGEE